LAPSSSKAIELADQVLLGAMALGTGLMLQPFWPAGLEWGIFLTLVSTVVEIVTSHLLSEPSSA
jgi:hypothetical protein